MSRFTGSGGSIIFTGDQSPSMIFAGSSFSMTILVGGPLDVLLIETGDRLLLESGDFIKLE